MKRSIYTRLGVSLLFVGVLFFGIPNTAFAFDPFGVAAKVLTLVLNPILYAILKLLGGLVSVLIELAIDIGTYNDFLNAPMVIIGWRVMRDVCNVGFIIGMLAIAFGTILKIQNYHYKNLLMKLLLMAILINFSKTIAGLLIDFSQVVMGTFMNAIKDTVAGNFVVGLGLEDLLALSPWDDTAAWDVDSSALFTSGLLAMVMLVFSIIIVFALFVMLLFRVIALWVLVILSPIAYLAQAIPSLKQYGDRWWKTFTKYLVNGPVIAFFLWLVLSLVSFNYQQEQITGSSSSLISEGGPTGGATSNDPRATITEAGSARSIFDFVTMIALLLMTLTLAAEAGTIGSDVAGSAISKVRGIGNKVGSLPGRAIGGGFRGGARYAAEVGTAVTGINMSPKAWADAFKSMRAQTRSRRLTEASEKARGRVAGTQKSNWLNRGIFGSLGDPQSFIDNYVNLKTLTPSGATKFGRRVLGLDTRQVVKGQKDIEQKQNTIKQLDNVEKDFENEFNNLEETKNLRRAEEIVNSVTDSQASRFDNALKNPSTKVKLEDLPNFKQQIDFQLRLKRQDLVKAKREGDTAKADKIQTEVDAFNNLSLGMGKSITDGKAFSLRDSIRNSYERNQIKDLAKKGMMMNARNDLRSYVNDRKANEDTRRAQAFTHWANNNLKDKNVSDVRSFDDLKTKRKTLEEDIKKNQKLITNVRPDEMFYSRTSGQELMNDEAKKIQHVKESTELLSLLEDARKNGNKARSGAIIRKMAAEGNQNDFLNAHGYKSHDINELHAFVNEQLIGNKVARRDDKGNIVTDKHGNADWMTWKELEKANLVEKYKEWGVDKKKALGLDEQTALSLEQEICFSAEGNSQYAMARGISYEDGRLVQIGSNKQSDIVVNQMSKSDAENQWRKMGRLAIGGEDAGGKFHLGPVGLKWLLTTGWTAAERPLKGSKNANQNLIANLSSDDAIKMILEAADAAIDPKDRATFDQVIYNMLDLARIQKGDVSSEMNRRIDEYLHSRAA